jgi:hypothetical protein
MTVRMKGQFGKLTGNAGVVRKAEKESTKKTDVPKTEVKSSQSKVTQN